MSDKTKQELKAELDQVRQDAMDTERRLLEEREAMLNEMYESGLRKRPTMLSKLEDIENQYRERINSLIEDCERTTGRRLKPSRMGYTATVYRVPEEE